MEDSKLDEKYTASLEDFFDDNGGWVSNKKYIYILIGGIYTLIRNKRLLRVGIMWKLLVLMGRSFFGKW